MFLNYLQEMNIFISHGRQVYITFKTMDNLNIRRPRLANQGKGVVLRDLGERLKVGPISFGANWIAGVGERAFERDRDRVWGRRGDGASDVTGTGAS
jgi:hypothetical protein